MWTLIGCDNNSLQERKPGMGTRWLDGSALSTTTLDKDLPDPPEAPALPEKAHTLDFGPVEYQQYDADPPLPPLLPQSKLPYWRRVRRPVLVGAIVAACALVGIGIGIAVGRTSTSGRSFQDDVTSTPSSPPPVPSGPVSPFAYITYHSYSPDTSLLTTSCSDGTHGLITRGYSMAQMYPAVSAASFTVWNSPECGACWALLNPANGVTVNVTIVDGCGPVAGYANHFDISPDAFTTLGGQAAVNVGHIIVEKYSKISEKPCGT